MTTLQFSFIIPVYNRPDEIDELLQSFTALTSNFQYEIVIIEDGSEISSKPVIDTYCHKLNISYYYKENSGPGASRNYGMRNAKGNYFIILDSDCLLPPQYLQTVTTELTKNFVDCFGGPDAAHSSFSPLQKAINFTMTSFITTGGIRGGKKQIKNYQPRSFNMGISKIAFEASNGFGTIHPGEDPDLSIRLNKLGFKTQLITEAFVYHKRRISWSKFYKQVNKFGLVRPILNLWHPETERFIFWLPSIFSFGLLCSLFLFGLGYMLPLLIYAIYFCIAFLVSLVATKSILIAMLSIVAIVVQFFGYGFGFIKSTIMLKVFKKDPKQYFPNLFFSKK